MIEFKDVSYSYGNNIDAVKNINLAIGKKRTVGIVGANGAGKSTLLLLLCGLIFADKGEILIDKIKLSKSSLKELRRRIGMVFQESDDQLFMTTVSDDVAFGPRNHGLDEDEVEKNIIEALEIMNILHLKDKAPYNLSGGEKRSVAISSVLSMHPEILIMDEPTSSLDPKARRGLINQIKRLEHTKIIASHDLDMIMDTCDTVVILKYGEIIYTGGLEILSNEHFMDECGLEIPLSMQKRR